MIEEIPARVQARIDANESVKKAGVHSNARPDTMRLKLLVSASVNHKVRCGRVGTIETIGGVIPAG